MSRFSTRVPTIQARISALVVACVLPAALAATLLLYRDFAMEHRNLERSTMDTARALSLAIDKEFANAEATLLVLAASPHLKNGELQSFYLQIQEIAQRTQDAIFVLSDAKGRQIINTSVPFGTTLPLHGDLTHFNRVLDSGEPIISDLFDDGMSQGQMVAAEIATRQDRRPAYVLSMVFFARHFSEILRRQRLPSSRKVSLLDRTGTVVADNGPEGLLAGKRIDAHLFERMSGQDGVLEAEMQSGMPVLIAFNHSAASGWTLFISIPRDEVSGALWQSLSLIVVGALLLLTSGLTLANIIGGQISRSIRSLVAPALALGHGNTVIVPALHVREADDVGQALIKAAKLIEQRTRERDLANQAAQRIGEIKQKFEYQAYHDELTGLANRILFNQLIKKGIETCTGNRESLIVFYIDIDDFKLVNDRHGHLVGDELLRLFASRLKAGLREFDITARLGGDEFAAILMRANPEHGQATAQALIDTLSHPYQIGPLTISASASIGIAGFPESAASAEDLLLQADIAMYRAKTSGKHRCVVYDKSMGINL